MVQAKKKVIIRKVIKPKPKKWFGGKELVVVIAAIILTTLGIRATDTMLSDKKNKLSPERCSEEMVFISTDQGGFCMDRYEAAPGKDCRNQNPENQNQTKENLDQGSCQPISAVGVLPWRNISQNQAAIACAKAGKRLPSNKEWLMAAMGTPDQTTGWSVEDCQVAKNWEKQPGFAGSGSNCRSAAGAFDMIGNVWEWVDGSINEGVYKGTVLPEEGYVKGVDENGSPSETSIEADENYNNDFLWIKKTGVRGFARGGYWDNKAEAGQYSVYLVSPPSFAGTGVGFRCAK